MTKVTVSAKVPTEMAQKISETGYLTSDVMMASLDMFLNLSGEEQQALIWEQLQRKKRERVFVRYHKNRE